MKVKIHREHIPSEEYKNLKKLKRQKHRRDPWFLRGQTSDYKNFQGNIEDYYGFKLDLFEDIGEKPLEAFLKELAERVPIILKAYTNGEPDGIGQKEGYYYTQLRVELFKEDLEWIYETELAREAFSGSWFDFGDLTRSGDLVKMDDGTYMIRHLGRYSSGLRILVDVDKESLKSEKVDSETLGVRPDGYITGVLGDYFISKKGMKFFKAKQNGKDMLLQQTWGGAFNPTRGLSLPREGSLYYNRRTSSGGGLGVTWVVYKKDWTALDDMKEEKSEFHNVKIDFENLYSEINQVDKNRFFFQVKNQSCIGVKIYVNDFRQNKKSLAHVICRKRGEYTEIDIYEDTEKEAEFLLKGVYLYFNTKNRGASSNIDEDDSAWSVDSSSSPAGTITREIILFIIKKGKKVSLRGKTNQVIEL